MVRCRLVAAFAMLLLTASLAAAQNSTVSGRVANAQGGLIANAEATLRALPPPGTPVMPNMPNMPNMPAAMERTATAGADGAFTFTNVAAGDYVLYVDASGFERSSQTLTVGNQAQNLMVTLTPLIVPGAEEGAAAAAGVADTQLLLDRIKQLEARITDAVRKLPVVVMCAYDFRDVSSRNLFLGGLQCHPLKFHRQALRQNEQFIPSETFLATLQPEKP